MKTFILVIIFIFSSTLYAGAWVKQSDIDSPKRIYTGQPLCQSDSGERCYNIKLCMIDECSLQAVPDLTTIIKEEACVDQADCDAKNADNAFCEAGEFKFIGDRDADGELEAWCLAAADSPELLPDAARKTVKDADAAQVASDRAARDSAKPANALELSTCLTLTQEITGSLTGPQEKKCIRSIIRRLLQEQVPVGEL